MAAQQTFAFLTHNDAVSSDLVGDPTGNCAKKTGRKNPAKAATPAPAQVPARAPTHVLADHEKDLSAVLSSQATTISVSTDRDSVLRRLRTQVGCVSLAPTTQRELLSTGGQVTDDLLPSGGLNDHALTEWVGDSDSSGASVLSIITAASQLRRSDVHGPLVIVDRQGDFYPPAAVALGVPEQRMILVRPTNHADAVWAIDQALRCSAVGAVWSHVGSWLDDRDARRLQLAAEAGKTPGLLVRPVAVRGRPSFAEVRFHVLQSADRDVAVDHAANGLARKNLTAKITLDRCRGGNVGSTAWVQVDDQARVRAITHTAATNVVAAGDSFRDSVSIHHETAVVHLADQLARPASTQSDSQSPPPPLPQRRHRA